MSGKDAYAGSILFVDLSSRTVRRENTPEDLKRKFLGGNGFAVKLAYDLIRPGADPLGPENVLVFAVGPAAGTLIPCSSRFVVGSKSPLTGLFVDSYAGGSWGEELKCAGYDALVVTGVSPAPVYLLIDGDHVELRDAGHLWGRMVSGAQRRIAGECQIPGLAVAAIGPAGENLVRYASIIAGTRAAGRGGMGAVMGAKKLKAIAVRGQKPVFVPDQEGMWRFFHDSLRRLREHPGTGKLLPEVGTGAGVNAFNRLGMLPARNWQEEVFAGAENISGERLRDEGYFIRSKACPGCPIGCGKVASTYGVDGGPVITEGPEYETLYSFGSLLGNSDLDSIIYADRMCDELGIDTISSGVAIAFAMEAFERGILSPGDTGGIDLHFGNHRAAIDLLQDIAYRRGLGDTLAEGVKRAAEIIGRGSEKYAMHVKGMELPGHSARGLKGMALGYAVSTRGGTHQDTRPTVERSGQFDPLAVQGKGKMNKDNQDMTAVCDSLIICRYTEGIYGFFLGEDHVRMANLTTGAGYSLEDLRKVGERVYTLERLFNVREGLTRKDDRLPERFLEEPIPGGPAAGRVVLRADLDQMLDEYYTARGWDPRTGAPTEEKLRELGL